MDVLIIEPEMAPRRASIDGDLASLQSLVGGLIEVVYPFEDPVGLICNEEGKLLGLPLNRQIRDHDIIAGTFLIAGLGEEDFISLSPELSARYEALFAHPEIFLRSQDGILCLSMAKPPGLSPSI